MTDLIKAPYVEDLQSREAYAETVQVFFDTAGAVRLEFCVYRWSREKPLKPESMVPVARVVIPLGLAVVLRDQLSASIEAANQMGKLAQAPPASPTKN